MRYLLAFTLLTPLAAVAADTTVDIQKFAFAPQEITVAPGTKIVWINHDETPHAILSPDQEIKSQALDTGDHYEHVFANAGDFSYFCTLHPYMTGIVHVKK